MTIHDMCVCLPQCAFTETGCAPFPSLSGLTFCKLSTDLTVASCQIYPERDTFDF